MAHSNLPANISHTVLVHAGSYKNFLTQLSKYPQLKPKFVKRVAIHYYVVQLEDSGEKGVTKQEIYSLPIMAMREEFSSYIFFKNIRSYNNVLKRMCDGNHNKDAAYDLLQHMMTPFEKSRVLKLYDAKSLKIKEEKDKEIVSTSYYGEALKSMEVLNKLFSLSKVEVDDIELTFNELIKKETWYVGIHK